MRQSTSSYHDLQVPWYDGAVRCTVWFGYANGRKCFFIEPHSAADFFARDPDASAMANHDLSSATVYGPLIVMMVSRESPGITTTEVSLAPEVRRG
jgi:hypothetical protein